MKKPNPEYIERVNQLVNRSPYFELLSMKIIDVGPGAGEQGGEIVHSGDLRSLLKNRDSLTGKYLCGDLKVTPPNGRERRIPYGWMTIKGASLHNLISVDVNFPLGTLITITGVSGSGKSSAGLEKPWP